MDPYVIVGGGLAGAKAAETLRAEGFDGPVVLIGDEDELPYERPPLSKGYLLGKDPREGAAVHPAEWYDEQSVELRLGTRSARSTRPSTRSSWPAASGIRYGKLLLATGSLVRPLDVPGGDRVRTLRKLPDADALQGGAAARRPDRRRRRRLDRAGGRGRRPRVRRRGDA